MLSAFLRKAAFFDSTASHPKGSSSLRFNVVSFHSAAYFVVDVDNKVSRCCEQICEGSLLFIKQRKKEIKYQGQSNILKVANRWGVSFLM